MTMSPPLRSSNLTSVPIDANRIGWSPNQIHSNTASTGLTLLLAPPSTSSCDKTMVGLLQFCFSSLHFQPVPAMNDDMIQARGPAPGYPYHWLPVTAKKPPEPNRNALFVVTDFSVCEWNVENFKHYRCILFTSHRSRFIDLLVFHDSGRYFEVGLFVWCKIHLPTVRVAQRLKGIPTQVLMQSQYRRLQALERSYWLSHLFTNNVDLYNITYIDIYISIYIVVLTSF